MAETRVPSGEFGYAKSETMAWLPFYLDCQQSSGGASQPIKDWADFSTGRIEDWENGLRSTEEVFNDFYLEYYRALIAAGGRSPTSDYMGHTISFMMFETNPSTEVIDEAVSQANRIPELAYK